MKTWTVICLLFMALKSHAACFHFTNGDGPSRLGMIGFSSVAGDLFKASKICFFNSLRMTGGQFDSISLTDSQSTFLLLAVHRTEGPCNNAQRMSLAGYSGQSLGKNLSQSEAESVRLEVRLEYKDNLGLSLGYVTDRLNGKSYWIIEAK